MATISKAVYSKLEDPICQGDIFQNVKYNYIDTEDEQSISVVEFEFPYAIVISQACDVIAMDDILKNKKGKPTKFMPSILMCPIYDKAMAKSGNHIEDMFSELSLCLEKENIYNSEEYKVVKRDWHYRFHDLTISADGKNILENSVIDFKHYFTLPMSYLFSHKPDRILRLDDLFAEQITLKFSTYLSRVAIP